MLSREVHQFRFLLLWYKMDFFRNSIDTARKKQHEWNTLFLVIVSWLTC